MSLHGWLHVFERLTVFFIKSDTYICFLSINSRKLGNSTRVPSDGKGSTIAESLPTLLTLSLPTKRTGSGQREHCADGHLQYLDFSYTYDKFSSNPPLILSSLVLSFPYLNIHFSSQLHVLSSRLTNYTQLELPICVPSSTLNSTGCQQLFC